MQAKEEKAEVKKPRSTKRKVTQKGAASVKDVMEDEEDTDAEYSNRDGKDSGEAAPDRRPTRSLRKHHTERRAPCFVPKSGPIRRRILFVRNAQDCATVFAGWSQMAAVLSSPFPLPSSSRPDRNAPRRLADRSGGAAAHTVDPPLTTIGVEQAAAVARAVRASQIHVTAIFTAPAQRCVQTAQAIYEAIKGPCTDPKLRVDVDLEGEMTETRFLTAAELRAGKYEVEEGGGGREERREKETKMEALKRIEKAIDRILKSVDGTIVVVGHAATVDVGLRHLLGYSDVLVSEEARRREKIPWVGNVLIEQNRGTEADPDAGEWRSRHKLPAVTVGKTNSVDYAFIARRE